MKISGELAVYLFFLLSIGFSGCKDNFQPLQENNTYYFSIYGYLNASADTQWVRVTPVREHIDSLSDLTDVSVRIENIGTGEVITMNDSLFQRAGASYQNFWTTKPVEHNQSYRLIAEKTDGKSAQVMVQIPSELPTPVFVRQTGPGRPSEYYVLVDDQVNLADVQAIWYVRIHSPNLDVQRVFSFSYRNTAERFEEFEGFYTIQLFPDAELNEIERQVLLPVDGEIEVIYRQVFVASSGVELSSEIASLDEITYALPDVFSNIENGVGFLAGIDSKIIPYRSCTDDSGQLVPCPDEKAFW